MTDVATIGRLRWRARRGMQELDRLLARWLETRGAACGAARLVRFERLLETEDDVLWSWMSGQTQPADLEMAGLVDEIRADYRP